MGEYLKIKELTDLKRPPVIAELGTLHHHAGISGLLNAVKQTVEAGADLVKIQCINPLDNNDWASKAQKDRYLELFCKFPKQEWAEFFFRANQLYKTPIFTSVFDINTVNLLSNVLPCFKIAHRMNNHIGIIEAIRAKSKPLIVSISDEVPNIWRIKRENEAYLYVQAHEYPINARTFKVPGAFYDGLSLHTNDLDFIQSSAELHSYKIAQSKAAEGGESNLPFIELHVKCEGAEGPDTSFALSTKELSILIKRFNRT